MPEPIILVLDDEPNIVRLCQRLLERENYRVLVSTSPSQALAILAREHIDLLLVDIRMPGLDGFEILPLARRHQPELAAVIMTGYGTLETAIHALQEGADGLILKPFTAAELIQNIQRAFQDSQQKRDLVRLRALRPLFDVTETLFSETDPIRLQNLIVELTCEHLNCSVAGFYLQSGQSRSVQLVAWRGKRPPDHMADQEQATMQIVLDRGKPLWVHSDESNGSEFKEYIQLCGLSAMLCVPVTHKDFKSIFLAARDLDEMIFREADLELFLIFARQAIVALDNAHLYAELRLYVQQVEKSHRALIQAEKMAAAGRLTASIAHEINNPLQSLSNCLDLASRKELQILERQRYLEMARIELDRLISIVQRMLEFYRPGVRDRQLCNLNELIYHVLRLLSEQLKKNRAIVKVELSPELPMVTVVVNQIQQVLLNLILNSMEAMPVGGEIMIQTAPSKTSSVAAGENEKPGVEILLEDSGPGIPESQRELIFEPYYSTKEDGTGLGLAVSYGIITAHGGTLSLVPGRGKGACFRIYLPEENAL